eukprot:m.471459 g.471459  ORF g.471459 m.471459 type:complete len:120 (+) comp31085_c0_seq1:18-377(+)
MAASRVVRNLVYRSFYATAQPPTWSALARVLGFDRTSVADALNDADTAHDVVLIRDSKGGTTDHILMAHPFSAIATPHTAVLDPVGVQRTIDRLDDWLCNARVAVKDEGSERATRWYGN